MLLLRLPIIELGRDPTGYLVLFLFPAADNFFTETEIARRKGESVSPFESSLSPVGVSGSSQE